jgi:hypothetical protein
MATFIWLVDRPGRNDPREPSGPLGPSGPAGGTRPRAVHSYPYRPRSREMSLWPRDLKTAATDFKEATKGPAGTERARFWIARPVHYLLAAKLANDVHAGKQGAICASRVRLPHFNTPHNRGSPDALRDFDATPPPGRY